MSEDQEAQKEGEELFIPEESLHTQSTQCEHFMVWEDENTAVCDKGCGHGCSLDRAEADIVDGKIVWHNQQ